LSPDILNSLKDIMESKCLDGQRFELAPGGAAAVVDLVAEGAGADDLADAEVHICFESSYVRKAAQRGGFWWH